LLARIHRQFADKSAFAWGVEAEETTASCGTCTLFTHEANMRAEVGCLRSAHWGEAMGEALSALIDHVQVLGCGGSRPTST
jgi:hypothetical protein